MVIREAVEEDVLSIRDLFESVYQGRYPHKRFIDLTNLKRMIYEEESLLLVAEDEEEKRVLGTASVIFDVGAHGDLLGEFGRLVVHPEARSHGVGKQLMQERLARAEGHLHVAFVDNRVVHPFSQRISYDFGFRPVGFLPQKLLFTTRESLSMYARLFEPALTLRRNHPHVISEVFPVAEMALHNLGIRCDVIADETSPSYPHDNDFDIEEMTSEGYPSLLRIERGRVLKREIFGAVRLHMGWFKICSRMTSYFVARRTGRVAGAIGFTIDPVEKSARIFELICRNDQPVRFLLQKLLEYCRSTHDVHYIEVDVSAYAPSMQRTLYELGFFPVAYVPAMAFHRVERLDAVRMAWVEGHVEVDNIQLFEESKPIAELVLKNFQTREMLPDIAKSVPKVELFTGLNDEQIPHLAHVCQLRKFQAGDTIFHHGGPATSAYIVLKGEIDIQSLNGKKVGEVKEGECLGEIALLTGNQHAFRATAPTQVSVAEIIHKDLLQLLHRRPDIGTIIYRNLALGLGEKLKRTDETISE